MTRSVALGILAACSCATGSRVAVTAGPMLSDPGAGVAVAIEVSPVIYDPPEWTRAGGGRLRLSRSFALAATASAGGMWLTDSGASAASSVGLDLVPIFHTHAHRDRIGANLVVGLGGHLGYALGGDGGAGFAGVPRLWFEAALWHRGLAHYTLGGMFRCQLSFRSEPPTACGPALIASRIRLHGSVPRP